VASVSAIVTLGFRRAAHRVHPDHGGATLAMRELTEARDWLVANVLEPEPAR
jgi:hypothetical protein